MYERRPEFIREMADGTVKQLNPFTGTEVWTVPGRGHRPIAMTRPKATPLTAESRTTACAFCSDRYRETPPEKARLVMHGTDAEVKRHVHADHLFDEVADFRRIPNLFEILSLDYWRKNYGYDLPRDAAAWRSSYLESNEGRRHVLSVVDNKLKASGRRPAEIAAMTEDAKLALSSEFFGGGHDVIVARRHFTDDAETDAGLASSGTLTADEHARFIEFTVRATKDLYDANPYARNVSVFQNWLKPAGASFDHLHKQLVAIDERGGLSELTLDRLRANPNAFNEDALDYAMQHNLLIAENDHAVMYAGFGHRYPTIEVYSTSEVSDPWAQDPAEVRGLSDLLHAAHAATGPHVPCNEEWHARPIDVAASIPWHVVLKWRVSTPAGFEGATKIYVNTIDPAGVRDRVLEQLEALREEGRLAPGIRLGDEVSRRRNRLPSAIHGR